VFEIGSSLRQARERRGVELSDVERVTRIRSRYLNALEEERFELIPGLVYAKGFLRTYADYLDLDADAFVDELASRWPPEEEEPLASTPLPVARRRRLSGAPLLGLVVVVVAGVIIGVLGATKDGSKPRAVPPPEPPPARVPGQRNPAPTPSPQPVRKRIAALVLRASAGRCWIEADAGSPAGRRLYYSTLEQGRSLRLSWKRIWLRVGAPSTLSATLNGKPVALPRTDSPVDLLVTPSGVQAG
jgi:transcriptional regulator with XRE-family HTH domain